MSHQKREKNPFYDYQSESTDQKRTFISERKSPRSVCVSKNNPLLLQAVKHLQNTIEMRQWFDLGLQYRMLDKPDDAIECFSLIAKKNLWKTF